MTDLRAPFVVCGHVRSGNHFLAEALHARLCPNLPGRTYDNQGTGHWSRRSGKARYASPGNTAVASERVFIPYAEIMGHHRFPKKNRGGCRPVVYVYRDGRDVALSCWRWRKMRARRAPETFSEWLRTPINWRGSPGTRSPVRPGYLLWHHWLDHVDAWASVADVMVRYESLVVASPAAVATQVAARFGLTLTPESSIEASGMVGWNPSPSPGVARWRDAMRPADVALFDEIVPRDHFARWGEDLEAS